MEYKVYANDRCIGHAIINEIDDGMGVYVGRFEPTPAYDEVRSVFLLYTQSAVIRERTGEDDEQLLEQFFKGRDELDLSFRREDGVIIPTSWILILDFVDEIQDDELEIHVQITEPELMRTPANKK
jgi:hypothetical protein